jgi:hypothetical protein
MFAGGGVEFVDVLLTEGAAFFGELVTTALHADSFGLLPGGSSLSVLFLFLFTNIAPGSAVLGDVRAATAVTLPGFLFLRALGSRSVFGFLQMRATK